MADAPSSNDIARQRIGGAVLAALTLILGFAVASLTGNRLYGGILLAIGGLYCAWIWWRLAGPGRALICVAIAGVAFIVSHPLGAVITSWGAVLLVSAITAVAAYAIATPRNR